MKHPQVTWIAFAVLFGSLAASPAWALGTQFLPEECKIIETRLAALALAGTDNPYASGEEGEKVVVAIIDQGGARAEALRDQASSLQSRIDSGYHVIGTERVPRADIDALRSELGMTRVELEEIEREIDCWNRLLRILRWRPYEPDKPILLIRGPDQPVSLPVEPGWSGWALLGFVVGTLPWDKIVYILYPPEQIEVPRRLVAIVGSYLILDRAVEETRAALEQLSERVDRRLGEDQVGEGQVGGGQATGQPEATATPGGGTGKMEYDFGIEVGGGGFVEWAVTPDNEIGVRRFGAPGSGPAVETGEVDSTLFGGRLVFRGTARLDNGIPVGPGFALEGNGATGHGEEDSIEPLSATEQRVVFSTDGVNAFQFNETAETRTEVDWDSYGGHVEAGWGFDLGGFGISPGIRLSYLGSMMDYGIDLDTAFQGQRFENDLDWELRSHQLGAGPRVDVTVPVGRGISFVIGGHLQGVWSTSSLDASDCFDANQFQAGCDGGLGRSNSDVAESFFDIGYGAKASLDLDLFCDGGSTTFCPRMSLFGSAERVSLPSVEMGRSFGEGVALKRDHGQAYAVGAQVTIPLGP